MGKMRRLRCTFEAGRVESWRVCPCRAIVAHRRRLWRGPWHGPAASKDPTLGEEAVEHRAIPAPASGALGERPFDAGSTSGGFLHPGLLLLTLRPPSMAEHHSSSCMQKPIASAPHDAIGLCTSQRLIVRCGLHRCTTECLCTAMGSGEVHPTPGHPASGVTSLYAPQAAPVWQDPRAPWYALTWRARRDAVGPHGGRRAAGLGGGRPLLA